MISRRTQGFAPCVCSGTADKGVGATDPNRLDSRAQAQTPRHNLTHAQSDKKCYLFQLSRSLPLPRMSFGTNSSFAVDGGYGL
ncbi:MAG: hypothetical protein JO235_20525 [Chroococcidiopsidaceae cyanobacterium CP_BM_RX_35]|nr:hypothetical protein [Chroococcidiopsidaceae cyanobacterium CP_BM_RX_35]